LMYPEAAAFKLTRLPGSGDLQQNSTGYSYSGFALIVHAPASPSIPLPPSRLSPPSSSLICACRKTWRFSALTISIPPKRFNPAFPL
jgi:hypothetical protein